MGVRGLITELVSEASPGASEEDLRRLVEGPLFTSRLLRSVRLLTILVAVEAEIGPLSEADFTTENFDTLAAIERLMSRYRRSADPEDLAEGALET